VAVQIAKVARLVLRMCIGAGDPDLDAKRNREIEKLIREDGKKMAKEVKLLLLGAGESGKSTILKQMKLIHTAGFSKNDRDDYKVIIFSNILNSIKLILEVMESFNLRFSKPENEVLSCRNDGEGLAVQ
jgi:guanine nucleotide-binding protein subunit alpha